MILVPSGVLRPNSIFGMGVYQYEYESARVEFVYSTYTYRRIPAQLSTVRFLRSYSATSSLLSSLIKEDSTTLIHELDKERQEPRSCGMNPSSYFIVAS